MSASATGSVFRLRPPIDEDELRSLRASVTAAVRDGERHCAVDLDGLAVLDSPVIATLIATLREVRELGAELTLYATRRPILETLRVTALDRIFAVKEVAAPEGPISPDGPADAGRAGLPSSRRSFATGVALVAMLAGGLLPLATAQAVPEADGIVEHVVARNAALQSYQANVHVSVRMQSFPFLAPHLEGKTYFKRPDNYEVIFEHVPGYARGMERLYTDAGDPVAWPHRFNMTVVGQRNVQGHGDVVIRLVQKVRGMIDHVDVAVDSSSWHIDEMEWHYYNGGVITMTQNFEHAGPWTVLASQHAVIHIPYVRAVADARYDGYRTNVAVDDAIFSKNHGK